MQLVTRNYIKFPKWNNALRQLITSTTIPVIIFIFWFLSGGGGGENASFVQLLFSRQLSSFFLSVSSPYKRYILFWIENAIRAQLLQVPSQSPFLKRAIVWNWKLSKTRPLWQSEILNLRFFMFYHNLLH